MDEIDLKLLYLLKHNARLSLTKMGKELSLSIPSVTYRMNKLIDDKLITGFTITINEQKLTPNYISYLIRGRTIEDEEKILHKLDETGKFEYLAYIASHYNLVGITRNISSEDLSDLIKEFAEIPLSDFKIETIIKKQQKPSYQDVIAEEVSSVYCPLCQKKFDGKGIITMIGSQLMGFCCEQCKNDFNENYLRISNEM